MASRIVPEIKTDCAQESWLRDRGSDEDPISFTGSRDGRWKQVGCRRERKAENGLTHLETPSSPSLHTLLHPAGCPAQQA